MSIFSPDELRRRQSALIARLDDEQCLVVSSFHNSFYASGLPMLRWGRLSVTLLFPAGDPILITPDFERDAAAEFSPIADVRLFRDEDGPTKPTIARLVAEALRERGATELVAIEGEDLTVHFQALLAAELPTTRFVDRTDVLDEVRIVHSAEEIAYVREASRIADVGMQRIHDRLTPEITEAELARECRRAMEDAARADQQVSVTCYLQAGERSGQCHALPSPEPIGDGVMVEIIIEVEVWYYQASLERPLIVGTASPEVERAVAAAADAFAAAIAEVGPDRRYGDVDEAGRAVLHAGGYDRITTGAGLFRGVLHHSGGRSERGELRSYNDRRFVPDTVVTVEPWAIVEGVGGPRHCDVVLVTADGHEQLTRSPGGVLRVAGRVPSDGAIA